MAQRLWEGPEYEYDEVEAMLGKIKKQVRWKKFEGAAQICDTLSTRLRELKNDIPRR